LSRDSSKGGPLMRSKKHKTEKSDDIDSTDEDTPQRRSTLGTYSPLSEQRNTDEDNLFNLTRKLTSLTLTTSPPSNREVIIMDHQKLSTEDLPLLRGRINEETTKIELMCNKLKGSDIEELCKHMEGKCLSVLTTLNLAENFIGDEGAKAIGDYLIEPACVLHSLTLSNNKITDKGGVPLVQSLEENKSVEILNLDCNDLTDITLAEIERALNVNSKCPLKNLSLAESQDKHMYTKQGAKCLWRLMANKPQLAITGDPPFTLGGESASERKLKTSIAKAKEKLIGQQQQQQQQSLDVFHNIALESIQRLRFIANSNPMIIEEDEDDD